MRMYDTVTPADLPADAPAIALYIDGRYKVSDDVWAAHPTALRCEIAVDINTHRGQVLDCEPGNCTPSQTPYWVAHRKAAGVAMPVIYCSLSAMAEVLAYNNAAGHVIGIWAGEWTGEDHTIAGTVGCQWANPERLPAELHGRNLDVSTITDTSWLLPALGEPFPLAPGDWYGRPSADDHNHSGYFWPADRPGIQKIQAKYGIVQDGL
ncbi:MAG: hypothetical protein ACREQ5_10445, partial [Candidatus Dormibacteria bacterium]